MSPVDLSSQFIYFAHNTGKVKNLRIKCLMKLNTIIKNIFELFCFVGRCGGNTGPVIFRSKEKYFREVIIKQRHAVSMTYFV